MNKKKGLLLVVLFLAVVGTAFSVSGTYAKYTSSDEKSDSARVAQWKLDTLTDINLFQASYDQILDSTEADAESTNGDKIVAPGTSGSYTFNIVGIFETNYRLDVELLDESHSIRYEINPNGTAYVYDPIQFRLVKVNNEDLTETEVQAWTTFDTFKTALEGLSETNYIGTESEKKIINDTYRIEWKWDFEGDGILQSDEEDTLLGNAIAETVAITDDAILATEDDYARLEDLSVRLSLKLSATQVK